MVADARSGWFSWMPQWLTQWSPVSHSKLIEAEEALLKNVNASMKKKFVTISNDNKLWTLSANTDTCGKVPIVMLHGFGSGIGLWALNIAALSKIRPLHCFDLLGFGQSSRPQFSLTPEEAEKEFVQSIEDWREAEHVDKMVLLGHSFGGYLAAAYTMKHPERVQSLILADPWGFPERDPDPEKRRPIPLWVRGVIGVVSLFNPLAGIRAAGPWGPNLIARFRRDISSRFSSILSEEDQDAPTNYIYHCNAQSPSGEVGFKTMSSNLGYSYSPMLNRIDQLDHSVPVTFIYGARSWMDISSGHKTKEILKDSQVEVYSIKGAGHNVHTDQSERFNEIVNSVCEAADVLE